MNQTAEKNASEKFFSENLYVRPLPLAIIMMLAGAVTLGLLVAICRRWWLDFALQEHDNVFAKLGVQAFFWVMKFVFLILFFVSAPFLGFFAVLSTSKAGHTNLSLLAVIAFIPAFVSTAAVLFW